MSLDIFGNPKSTLRLVTTPEEQDYQHPVSKLIDSQSDDFIEETPTRRPVTALFITLILSLSVLVVQLFKIQVISFPYYQNLASGNSIRIQLTLPPRGLIFDQKQKPLVQNINKHALAVNLSDLPRSKKERQKLYRQLQKIINLTNQEITEVEKVAGNSIGQLILRKDLDRETMLLFKEKLTDFPAFTVVEKPIRQYETTPGLSQVLGYLGRVNEEEVKSKKFLATEEVGRQGLEKTYDSQMRGTPGRMTVEVDALGNVVRTISTNENSDPQPGYSLELHLDNELQKVTAQALQEAMDQRDKKFGENPKLGAAAVVINPKDGGIISLVSLNSYDNNLFASGISNEDYQKIKNDPGMPMFNRVTQAQLPSGSTIKPVIAASALTAGIVSAQFSIDTPAVIQVGNYTFPDWTDHGRTDIRRAIAESNNIFFYGLGGGWKGYMTGLGIDRMVEYLEKFGFGSPTGIDLPGESSGFVPTPEWKLKKRHEQWYIGDTYHLAIGQGDFLTTPIQLATATSAIANGGILYKPKLVSALIDKNNKRVKVINPEIKNQNFATPYALQIVREGMREAVEYGSSRQLNSLKTKVAGKTGTAQYGNEGRTHAWFTCFAPYEDPKIVITVVIEGGGEGHLAALPVAEKILRAYFNEPAPPPPKEKPEDNVEAEDANSTTQQEENQEEHEELEIRQE